MMIIYDEIVDYILNHSKIEKLHIQSKFEFFDRISKKVELHLLLLPFELILSRLHYFWSKEEE